MPSRRQLLVTAGGALAAALAGCGSQESTSGGRFRWVPDPAAVGLPAALSAGHTDVTGLRETARESPISGGLVPTANRFLSELHGKLLVTPTTDPDRPLLTVSTGSVDTDRARSTLLTEGFEQTGTTDGFERFRRESTAGERTAAVAVGDRALVRGAAGPAMETTSAALLEGSLAAAGGADRYTGTAVFGRLAERVADATEARVRVLPQGPSTTPTVETEAGDDVGVVGAAAAVEFGEPTTVRALTLLAADEPVPEPPSARLRDQLRLVLADAADVPGATGWENVSVRQDGRVLVTSGDLPVAELG
jgi:hypothetical protein